jgi:hypothetical protein
LKHFHGASGGNLKNGGSYTFGIAGQSASDFFRDEEPLVMVTSHAWFETKQDINHHDVLDRELLCGPFHSTFRDDDDFTPVMMMILHRMQDYHGITKHARCALQVLCNGIFQCQVASLNVLGTQEQHLTLQWHWEIQSLNALGRQCPW